MENKTNSLSKNAFRAFLILLALVALPIIIGYFASSRNSAKAHKSDSQHLPHHTVINESYKKTPVSAFYDVYLLVSKDIKRKELETLLAYYMNQKKNNPQNGKKLIISIFAYTDSLRYKRGEQWLGLLNLNEFQKPTPDIRYDEVNLVDGISKNDNTSELSNPVRQKIYYDISNYDYEASEIMEDKHPMSNLELITYMQNGTNRSKYLAEEESIRNRLISYYMKKYRLSHEQFELILSEGNHNNWTRKSVEDSKKSIPMLMNSL